MRGPVIVSVFAFVALWGCAHRPIGRLAYEAVDSRSEAREMRYGVYVPPGWDRRTPLPLVVLLHGAGDDETAADRRSVISALDRAVTAGDVPPFIMVTPNGERGLWVNWHDGSHRYRDWVLDEVVPRIRATYPVVEGAAGLHLMGVSMGGGGGLQMWLADPALFASATIISAPILGEEDTRAFLRRFASEEDMNSVFGPPGAGSGVDPYAALVSESSLRGSRLIFGAATHDRGSILESNIAFHNHLLENDVPHIFAQFPGRHGWAWWADMFVFSLCRQLNDSCAMQAPGSAPGSGLTFQHQTHGSTGRSKSPS